MLHTEKMPYWWWWGLAAASAEYCTVDEGYENFSNLSLSLSLDGEEEQGANYQSEAKTFFLFL
jgi:hypothetical protein